MIRLLFHLELLLRDIIQIGPAFGQAPQKGRSASEKGGGGPVCPVHEASRDLIPPPTWQGPPAGLEVVHSYEVAGQVKHGPAQSHCPVLSTDVLGDGVKGAKGGNPDPLRVEEKGKAEALRAGMKAHHLPH